MNDKIQTIPVGPDYEPMGKYGLLNMLGIRTEERNLNPNRDERAEDCAIRSVLMVINHNRGPNDIMYTWDYVYDRLATIGRSLHRLMNNYMVVNEFMNGFGYQLVVPIKSVQLGTFLVTHKYGSYIVSFNDHAFAYIDGTIYDTGKMFNEISFNLSTKVKSIYVPRDIQLHHVLKD